jgi:hypothetical protein
VNAVSVAASAGGFAGIGLSGAGASVANSVAADVKAYINGTDPGKNGVGARGVFADNVTLDARDDSSVDATVGAVSVAVGLGFCGLAVSIGISDASNSINNDVQAYATAARIGATGDLTITATEQATIAATATAAAVAISTTAAGAGTGVTTGSIIRTTTRAYADPVELDVGGGIRINAIAADMAEANAFGNATSVGLASVSGASTRALATVVPVVESRLGGYGDARRVMAGGDIEVGSTVGAGATARSVGDAFAIGLGIAVGETAAIASVSPAVTSTVSAGHVVSTGGGLDVKAISVEFANADAQAAAGGGLVGASGATAQAIVKPVLDAHIGSNTVVDVVAPSWLWPTTTRRPMPRIRSPVGASSARPGPCRR